MKTKTCPELVSGLIGSSRLKKKGSLVKARLKDKRIAKRGGSSSTKEPKPTAMNTVFLDLRTSIEECEKVIKTFKKLGYTTYYDSKTKTLKTTAPKTRIKELSKLFKCIQSYSLLKKSANYNGISLMQKLK